MRSEVFVFFLPVLADGASDSDSNRPSSFRGSDGTVATRGVHVLLTHYAGTAVGGFPGPSLLGPHSPPHCWSLKVRRARCSLGGRYLCSVSEDLFSGWLLVSGEPKRGPQEGGPQWIVFRHLNDLKTNGFS